MNVQLVILCSDLLMWALVAGGAILVWLVRRDPLLRAAWEVEQRLGAEIPRYRQGASRYGRQPQVLRFVARGR